MSGSRQVLRRRLRAFGRSASSPMRDINDLMVMIVAMYAECWFYSTTLCLKKFPP